MRILRLKDPSPREVPGARDCLMLLIPKRDMTAFIQRLVELNSGPAPTGADGVVLSLNGTVEQHFEEWRPLADNAPGATTTETLHGGQQPDAKDA